MNQNNGDKPQVVSNKGRYPTNIILDEKAGEILDEQTGELKSGAMKKPYKYKNNGFSLGQPTGSTKQIHDSNKRGASRFFYCAKASKSERNTGCEGLSEKSSQKMGNGLKSMVGHPSGNSGNTSTEDRKSKNFHPTVKPIKLIEYLCKLTETPTGGVKLDPFMGSGTMGIVFEKNNYEWIGIEIDKDYCEIAKQRIGNIEISKEDIKKETKKGIDLFFGK